MSTDEAKPLLPDWLNNGFLETILRKYYDYNGLIVMSSDVRSTSANGEGFMSSMYRARVNFRGTSIGSEKQVSIFPTTFSVTHLKKVKFGCDVVLSAVFCSARINFIV